jgi:hypothetical protein
MGRRWVIVEQMRQTGDATSLGFNDNGIAGN